MPDPAPPDGDKLRLHLLVLGAQAGNAQAFTRLFEEFGTRTLGYLRGLVADSAEDVQQEVWLAVYRSLASLANPGAFGTWLFQTTRHRALDHLRRRKREHRLLDETALQLVTDAGELQEEDAGGLGDLDLQAIAAALPPALSEVLLLRYGNDLSYAEIALVVGCAVGTVRSRLHSARLRARQIIEGSR